MLALYTSPIRQIGKFMEKKLHLLNVAFFCILFAESAFSLELRPFVQWFNQGDVTVSKDQNGVKSDVDFPTDFVLEGGAELLFTGEYNPMRYGLGVGYRTALKDGDNEATPATIPLWGTFTFGRIDPDAIASPYMAFRGGTLFPLTTNGNWWERPLNWLVGIGVGAIFPFGIGLEVFGEYSSMLKSFDDNDLEIYVDSPRFGAILSVGIELIRDRIYKGRKK